MYFVCFFLIMESSTPLVNLRYACAHLMTDCMPMATALRCPHTQMDPEHVWFP